MPLMRLRLPIAHLHMRVITVPPSPFGSHSLLFGCCVRSLCRERLSSDCVSRSLPHLRRPQGGRDRPGVEQGKLPAVGFHRQDGATVVRMDERAQTDSTQPRLLHSPLPHPGPSPSATPFCLTHSGLSKCSLSPRFACCAGCVVVAQARVPSEMSVRVPARGFRDGRCLAPRRGPLLRVWLVRQEAAHLEHPRAPRGRVGADEQYHHCSDVQPEWKHDRRGTLQRIGDLLSDGWTQVRRRKNRVHTHASFV